MKKIKKFNEKNDNLINIILFFIKIKNKYFNKINVGV